MADQDQNNQGAQNAANASNGNVESPEKKSGRKFIVIGVVLLLVVLAGLYYWRSTFSEDTDDAQVDGDIYQVSSRISGQVLRVDFEDNKKVEANQLLVEIDPKDYQVALEQAQAALASAQADYTTASANVPITSVTTNTTVSTSGSDVRASTSSVDQAQKQAAAAAARVEQAQANAIKARLDVERYTPLVEKDVISKQQFDAAVATARASSAAVIESEASLVAAQSAISQAQQKLDQSRFQAAQASKNGPQEVAVQRAKAASALANVKQAQAKVDQALLNLSYTRVLAPTAGIVNKKNVQVGANLSIGQDLVTIVPLNNLWVTANFKETQLEQMKPGQEVTLKVDALGGRKFSGKVTQVGGATGSRLSLFPPENATGNYVKVVQRIPVRIDFTNLQQENGDYALRPGFSVTPEVRVKN
ncbi:membrane fusion protein, multidrug efflux system [Granulicella rosea]|uniref:Membrane fusion protein, multidrug efflux system n=1 Tax=Granulicella rosea TaxID=474952 RepID=A0A239HCV0_9BACT|nr:HlyD family secretion protein [Granulicella rosea]SNS79266.1 membrane fusion protein, multidrug efflux system [Granulicella rosea]